MKGRASGMQDEACWAAFFQPEGIFDRLLVTQGGCYKLVEFGCGHGMFSFPAAKRTRCLVQALDIDPVMIELVARAKAHGLLNVRTELAAADGLSSLAIPFLAAVGMKNSQSPNRAEVLPALNHQERRFIDHAPPTAAYDPLP